MLRPTLRQARSTAGRLLLAGVAVAMGTGFVAAVLLTSALFTRTTTDSVAAQYRGADVVVRTNGTPLTDAEVADVAGAPSVAAADGRVDSGVQLVGASGTEYAGLRNTTTAPALAAADHDRLAAGELPSSSGQVALSAATAQRLGAGLGGSLSVRTYPVTTDLSGAATEPVDVPVTVVGLLSDDTGALFDSSGAVLATTADALAWSSGSYTDVSGAPLTGYSAVLVVTAPGASPQEARDAVADRLRTAGLQTQTGEWDPSQGWTGDAPPVDVLTTQQVVDSAVDSALGGTRVLTSVVLAFAAVALFVATTVITNTFSVLVAQRTHQLALLRCVGATKRQVQRSVLAEAAALGVVASSVGVLVGAGLSTVAAAVLAHLAPGVPVPTGVVLTPAAVVAPLVVGTGVTVVAALAPARAATRVSPLAALRPAAAPDLRTRTSRLRLASSLVLLLGGGVLLVGGVLLATGVFADAVNGATGTSDELAVWGVAAAVVGGMASFSGVLLGAVFLVPRAVGLVGRLVARGGGAPARLAALNAVRNPRRTASTTGALLIGTTLVALMVVGAATTSRTLAAALDRQYPVDVQVTSLGGPDGPEPLAPEVVRAATAVPGVRAWTPVLTASLTANRGTTPDPRSQTWLEAAAASRGQLASVLPDPAWVAALAPGTVVVPRDLATSLGVSDGDEVVAYPSTTQAQYDDQGTPTGWAGAAPQGHVLRVAVTDLGGYQALVLPGDLTAADPAATTSGLWVHLSADADPVAVADDVQTAVTDAGGTDASTSPVAVSGAAAERAGYERVIDTMLLVVVGLLAVAVLIALVGVANTLSLSVIERTRENAVLRALGLTRGQLRRMLALEGALVAGVGGLLGVVLGSLYGWAGAASLLGGAAAAGGSAIWTPELPWGRLALLLGVAVAAGLLASVLPARRAVRTPPVAALAEQ